MQNLDRSGKWLLAGFGFLLIGLCLAARALGNLRSQQYIFVSIFFAAFILYAIACLLILSLEKIDRVSLVGIFALAAGMLASLVFTQPALSDDMYRYIWDGRVQAHGISPYRYPPDAPELVFLRDTQIYPWINRKPVVTVYPPAAEATFFLLWSILPDNIHWFQFVMAGGAVIASLLLTGLLRDLGRPIGRVVLFLWSPLLIFETAHSAHIDGLVLPLLVGVWWARVREKDGWVGFLLGVATAFKLYPALLLPFLWRSKHPKGRWTMRRGAWPVLYTLPAHQRRPGAGIPAQLLSGIVRREPARLWLAFFAERSQIEPAGRADLASFDNYRWASYLEHISSSQEWRSGFTTLYLADRGLYITITGSVCLVHALAVTAGRHFSGNG